MFSHIQYEKYFVEKFYCHCSMEARESELSWFSALLDCVFGYSAAIACKYKWSSLIKVWHGKKVQSLSSRQEFWNYSVCFRWLIRKFLISSIDRFLYLLDLRPHLSSLANLNLFICLRNLSSEMHAAKLWSWFRIHRLWWHRLIWRTYWEYLLDNTFIQKISNIQPARYHHPTCLMRRTWVLLITIR